MGLLNRLGLRDEGKDKPPHRKRGELGERAAKKHLKKLGLKFLAANFKSKRGEIRHLPNTFSLTPPYRHG